MSDIATLLDRWRQQRVVLLPPATAGTVRAAFDSLGATATTDVIALYGACGGMEQMDDEYWCLWSLEQLQKENSEPSESGVIFSDYLINSWCYRLKMVNGETSAVYVDYFDGRPPLLVAPSVSGFLAAYVVDPIGLLQQTA